MGTNETNTERAEGNPARAPERVVRVRADSDRFTFDGDTGFLVLAGTVGDVLAMTLDRTGRPSNTAPTPLLSVVWDTALLQDEANDTPTEVTGLWQESGVLPNTVTFVEEVERG